MVLSLPAVLHPPEGGSTSKMSLQVHVRDGGGWRERNGAAAVVASSAGDEWPADVVSSRRCMALCLVASFRWEKNGAAAGVASSVESAWLPPCVVLVINDNLYGLIFVLSYL